MKANAIGRKRWKVRTGGRRWFNARVVALLVMLLTLPGTVGVLAADTASGSSVVTANVSGAIVVEQWPAAEVSAGTSLVPGTSETVGPLTFVVKCNSTWGIEISSDDAGGQLREYDTATGEYVTSPLVMKNPLQWATNVAGPWTNVTGTPAAVYTGRPKTGDTGAAVDIYLRTTASFDDARLADGKEYRITLLYTAGVSY